MQVPALWPFVVGAIIMILGATAALPLRDSSGSDHRPSGATSIAATDRAVVARGDSRTIAWELFEYRSTRGLCHDVVVRWEQSRFEAAGECRTSDSERIGHGTGIGYTRVVLPGRAGVVFGGLEKQYTAPTLNFVDGTHDAAEVVRSRAGGWVYYSSLQPRAPAVAAITATAQKGTVERVVLPGPRPKT